MGDGGEVTDRLKRWVDLHIIIPRWALTLFYSLLSLLGAIAALNGIPTLDFTAGPTYVVVWSSLLFVSAGICAAASIHAHRAVIEKWAGMFLVGLLTIYLASVIIVLIANPSTGRGVGVIVVAIITLLPALRVTSLIFGKG